MTSVEICELWENWSWERAVDWNFFKNNLSVFWSEMKEGDLELNDGYIFNVWLREFIYGVCKYVELTQWDSCMDNQFELLMNETMNMVRYYITRLWYYLIILAERSGGRFEVLDRWVRLIWFEIYVIEILFCDESWWKTILDLKLKNTQGTREDRTCLWGKVWRSWFI